MNRRLRNPAAHGRADANHPAIAEALRALGALPVDLHRVGGGVEDLLVPVAVNVRRLPLGAWDAHGRLRMWLPIECKVLPIRYTDQQQHWRGLTAAWPRLTVTSGQDAVRQLRDLADERPHRGRPLDGG